MHMVEDEEALFPDFHLVVLDKLYPSSSTEIGLVQLVGDLNRVTRFGLFQRLNHDLKVSSMVIIFLKTCSKKSRLALHGMF